MERSIALRVTFDREADAAYVYFADEPHGGWRHGKTIPVDAEATGWMINLDLDKDGRLIGLEVLDAINVLSDKILTAMMRS